MSARKTPAELADMIRQNLDLDLDAIREFLSAATRAIDIDPLRPGPRPRLVAPSVTLDDVTVTVWLTASDPSYLGTSLHGHSTVIVRYIWHLIDGDKAYGFDIDLAGVRAQRLRTFDDPRARTAATSIGMLPFDQPVFRAPEVIDGVTWVRFGTPE